MPLEYGWRVLLVPAALVVGGILAGGVWYRRRSDGTSGLLGRVVMAGLAGALGYGLLVLAWVTTQDPVWQPDAPLTDWVVYALLLYFGLAIGFGTGRDGWPLAVGYLLVIGAVLATSGPDAVPYLGLCLIFLGIGFIVEDQLL